MIGGAGHKDSARKHATEHGIDVADALLWKHKVPSPLLLLTSSRPQYHRYARTIRTQASQLEALLREEREERTREREASLGLATPANPSSWVKWHSPLYSAGSGGGGGAHAVTESQ